MNRRGHLSSKVPNVKLRPAPAANGVGVPRTRGNQRSPSPLTGMDAVIQQREMEGEEDEDVSTAALRNVVKPWKDVVITFTGVERKTQFAALAMELGAKVDNALTVHVTHVVAISPGSDKYKYAIGHRIPVLTPDWIEDNHHRWLHGEDVDPEVDAYRLPPFAGLVICMSGIEPIERRKQIVAAVNAHGGIYSKDLTRDCTHLISAKPISHSKSSEKVQWACKELRDRSLSRKRGKKVEGADIRIIYEEWLWDCVAFHGRFEEDEYDAKRPRPVGKVRVEDVLDGTVFIEQEERERKKKQEVKEDEGEDRGPAVLRKRKRDDLVGELISTTASASASVKPEIDVEERKPPTGETTDSSRNGDGEAGPSRVPPLPTASSDLRKASLLHATRTASFGPARSAPDLATPSMPATMPQPPTNELLGDRPTVPQIFEGLRFSHLIDEAYEGLERALVAHGGRVLTETERLEGEPVDHVIVRLSTPRKPTHVEGVPEPVVVTECWVEGCCFEQSLLPIDKHLVFQPLPAPMPVAGTSGISIHLSGFTSENSTYLRRVIRVIGATQAISLNRQTTHLVSGKAEGPKVSKAREWGLKVVSEGWLLAVARTGQLVPESEYPLGSSSTSTEVGEGDRQPNSRGQSRELKPTPTHVDPTSTPTALHATASAPIQSLANPLSPPNGNSARKLNHASTSTLPRAAGDTGSEDSASASSKKSRAGSAAPDLSVKPSSSDSSKGKDVTDVLRQLAERGDTTPLNRVKAPRRSKNGPRARTSLAQRSMTPSSPNGPDANADAEPEDTPDIPPNPIYEESMRVSIADPAAERERKKMMDALRKSHSNAALLTGKSKSTR